MKNNKWLLSSSIHLNVIFVFAIVAGYMFYRFQQFEWNLETSDWATYAGTLQCDADRAHGIRRFYRVVFVPPDAPVRFVFTGQREKGLEIWSWPSYSGLDEASRISTQEFVDAYNRRQSHFLENSSTRPAIGKQGLR